jgi:hypothetical protein
MVMAIGSIIYWREVRTLASRGIDLRARVSVLPRD